MAAPKSTTKTKNSKSQASKKVTPQSAKVIKKVGPSRFSQVVMSIKPNFSAIRPNVNADTARNFFKTRTKIKAASLIALVLIATGLVIFGNRVVEAFQRQVGVAVVNGQVISKSELQHRRIQSYGTDMTSSLVDETLALQEGRKENVTISQKDIDDQIAKIQKQIAPQKLDDALAQRHLTKDDLERQIRVQLTVEKILGKGINISDSDIQNYFNQNKDTLAQQTGKKADDLKLEDVKQAIAQNLRSSQISAKYQAWVEGLRSKANIKTFI